MSDMSPHVVRPTRPFVRASTNPRLLDPWHLHQKSRKNSGKKTVKSVQFNSSSRHGFLLGGIFTFLTIATSVTGCTQASTAAAQDGTSTAVRTQSDDTAWYTLDLGMTCHAAECIQGLWCNPDTHRCEHTSTAPKIKGQN